MNISDRILIAELVMVIALALVAVYKNKTGKYTAGLSWPLEAIAAYLNNIARQPWQPRYFNSIIEHAVLTAVYTAVFKMIDGRLYILLTPRSDEYWKNVMHVPGAICRTSDQWEFYEDARARVQQRELKGIAYVAGSYFAGCGLVKTQRCKENFVVFVAFTVQDTNVGRFYPVDALPNNLIDHEAAVIIPTAVAQARKLMANV